MDNPVPADHLPPEKKWPLGPGAEGVVKLYQRSPAGRKARRRRKGYPSRKTPKLPPGRGRLERDIPQCVDCGAQLTWAELPERRPRCPDCQTIFRRRSRFRTTLKVLGITWADWVRLVASQDGHCALCPRTGGWRGLVPYLDPKNQQFHALCHLCRLRRHAND